MMIANSDICQIAEKWKIGLYRQLKMINQFVSPEKNRNHHAFLSFGDARVISVINWLADDDRTLNYPERRP
jgi:hypothetical protein